MSENNTE